MLIRLAIAAVLIVGATACKHNKHASTTVRNRAAFDLSCPKEDLTLVVADTDGARKLATQIGVYGCGQKAVYAYYPDANTWLIDGIVTPMASDFELPSSEGDAKKRADKKASKAEKRGKMNPDSSAPDAPAPAEAAPEAPAPDVPDPT